MDNYEDLKNRAIKDMYNASLERDALKQQAAVLRYQLDQCLDDYKDNYHVAVAGFNQKEARYCEERIAEIEKLLNPNEYSVDNKK